MKLYGGIDVGGTSMIAVVANRKGKILGSSNCVTNLSDRPESLIDAIAGQVQAAAAAAGVRTKDLQAIGIGAPGAVDPKKGIVVRAPNLGWTDVALAKELKDRTGAKVALGNDVQVAILGEHAFGVAKGLKRVVGIWVGTGIGGGIIINGDLNRGARGAAGEIGHTVINEKGPLCPCGRYGCVEAMASRTSIERDVRALSAEKGESLALKIMREKNKPRMTSSVIDAALKAGDPIVTEVLANAEHALGLLAGNLVNTLDPDMVVLGGGVAQRLKKAFVGPIREVARSRFLRPDPDHRAKIEHATLAAYSAALGACALAARCEP